MGHEVQVQRAGREKPEELRVRPRDWNEFSRPPRHRVPCLVLGSADGLTPGAAPRGASLPSLRCPGSVPRGVAWSSWPGLWAGNSVAAFRDTEKQFEAVLALLYEPWNIHLSLP